MMRRWARAARGAAAAISVLLACSAAWAQALMVLNPKEARSATPREFVNVLARTQPGAKAKVQGVEVPVYSSGVFVRDRVPLAQGMNELVVEVTAADGSVQRQTLQVERIQPPPPAPQPPGLWIDAASTQPRQTLRLAEGEAVTVSFRGTPGQYAAMRHAGSGWLPMTEREPGQYSARLVLRGQDDLEPAPVELRLVAGGGDLSRAPEVAHSRSAGAVGLWSRNGERWMHSGPEGAALTHGTHEVRLGGPFLAELPAGVWLRITGQQGEMLRVQLAPQLEAWVPQRSLVPVPPGQMPPPPPVFTSLSAGAGNGANAGADVITVPFPGNLPHAARVVMGNTGWPELELDLFGTHEAATWITHANSLKVVREVTVTQLAPQHVRVRATLQGPLLWGWRLDAEPRALRLVLRHPPALAAATASPLQGLVVAVEAGHGSSANLGAVGATGVPEKDINLWTSQALQRELEAAGARVVMIRVGDENPNLRERAQRVLASGAHLFVSVHANAADTANGYLRAGGTSTYYKHAHSRAAAAAVQQRMLAATQLPDFGLVGAFNYTPIRLVSWMPAILVEQAFVSNPLEEARMLEPAFREGMARAIRQGLEDSVRR